MNKQPDINKLTDREIIDLIMSLSVDKFTAVMQGLAQIMARLQERGARLAEGNSKKRIDEWFGDNPREGQK